MSSEIRSVEIQVIDSALQHYYVQLENYEKEKCKQYPVESLRDIKEELKNINGIPRFLEQYKEEGYYPITHLSISLAR